MDKINFLLKDNFPFSNKTADKLQEQNELLAKLTSIGGDNYIVSGCVDTGGVVSDGFIVVDGELLPFVGGALKTYLTIVETSEDVTAFGEEYPDAYINRHVELSDAGAYAFSDFTQVKTNQELFESIQVIQGTPPGVVEDWLGLLEKIPDNYMLCDGRALNKADYPELYDNIGTLHGSVGDSQFRLPDCGARFMVAYDNNFVDHDAIGKKGGSATVTLTEAQLPPHKIQVTADSDYGGNGSVLALGGGGATDVTIDSDEVGSGDSIENRPPYITVAKIIKVKY